MRKRKNDFKTPNNTGESYYDLKEDWGLIESSLAKQYGIRIRQHTDMPWSEFCTLIMGLMPDTPLGQIISIRSEKDRKIIKNFNQSQRKIYRDWQIKIANDKLSNPEMLDKSLEIVINSLKMMCIKKEVK